MTIPARDRVHMIYPADRYISQSEVFRWACDCFTDEMVTDRWEFESDELFEIEHDKAAHLAEERFTTLAAAKAYLSDIGAAEFGWR